MRISLFSTLLLITSLLMSVSSNSKQNITFGMGVFPPAYVVDLETGRCSGSLTDTLNKIFTGSGFSLTLICASPSRVYRMIENGEIDLTINITATDQLEGLVTFVTPPYQDLSISLFTHKNSQSSKVISAVRGYQYNGQRKRLQNLGFEFYDLPDTASSLRFFMKKRSTYLLSYQVPIIYMLNQKHNNVKHEIVEEKISSLPTYFAITNTSKMFEQIKNILDDYVTKHEKKHFLYYDNTDLYTDQNGVIITSH